MVRGLWELVFNGIEPNFTKPPYDLGGFDEVMHDEGKTDKEGNFFGASCSLTSDIIGKRKVFPNRVDVDFSEDGSIPVLKTLKLAHNGTWIEYNLRSDKQANLLFGVDDNVWEIKLSNWIPRSSEYSEESAVSYFRHIEHMLHWILLDEKKISTDLIVRSGDDKPSQEAINSLLSLSFYMIIAYSANFGEAYASAPVQSSPQRTYELSLPIRDIRGKHIPIYIARLSYSRAKEWVKLKRALERFGRSSGLFHEIDVKRLGTRRGGPFQVEIGLSKRGGTAPNRNLTDVGYGVSQALPVLTEFLRPDARHLLLLQQPEVHLHPRAQAALGSLFCRMPGKKHQIVVETHSDYILDRIRMDIRDKKGRLGHEDVAILFFHRSSSTVRIHPLRLDPAGNIVDAPPSYRRFFMRETDRLLRY